MKSDAEPPTPVFKTVYEIIHEVAHKYGLTYVEMLSQRRPIRLVHARQEAYWRCTKETLSSLPVIGRHFGNRDHTTILKGAQAHERRLLAAHDKHLNHPAGAGDGAAAYRV